MGVGKTFFAKEIAHALGADKRGTASPTFALVHEYRTTKALLLHVDLYRLLESVSFLYQVEMLGIRELRDEGAIALVEWGEKATEALGGEPIARVKLERTGATSRKISVDGEWIEPHLPCARELSLIHI